MVNCNLKILAFIGLFISGILLMSIIFFMPNEPGFWIFLLSGLIVGISSCGLYIVHRRRIAKTELVDF